MIDRRDRRIGVLPVEEGDREVPLAVKVAASAEPWAAGVDAACAQGLSDRSSKRVEVDLGAAVFRLGATVHVTVSIVSGSDPPMSASAHHYVGPCFLVGLGLLRARDRLDDPGADLGSDLRGH